MTYEEKVKYLRQYYDLHNDVLSLVNELEQWKKASVIGSPSLDGVGSSSHDNVSKVEKRAVKMYEIEERIQNDIDDAVETRARVQTAIESVKNRRQRRVLKMRYISFMKFEQIADTLGITTQAVYMAHKRGIRGMEL